MNTSPSSPLSAKRSTAFLFLLLSLLFAPHPLHAAEPPTTQTITLNSGWNLISIQIGNDPLPVAAFQAALADPSRLIEVWGYTPSGNPATPGVWQSFQPLVPSFPSDLTTIQQGSGYWVNVAQTTTLSLSGTPWNGTVSLTTGWNLVGFPGVNLATDEIQELSAVLGSSFDRIQQAWTFNTASNRFKGYDLTAIPALKDLAAISPGQGYWIYALDPLTITPEPFVALPGDSDASPPQAAEAFQATDPRWLGSNPPKYIGNSVRFRAANDSDTPYDLNANGILDDPYTQDTILFEKTADTVSITIGNNGNGSLSWVLENTCKWIYTAPADNRTWPAGTTTRPRNASGTVSSEKDTLLLYADRTGMTPGRESGNITLWVGGQAFPVSLLLDVAPVDGDWRGFATTTRVGGRNISLGEVRLALNCFSSNGTDESAGFRAVLNREKSILFPRDVFMDGVFYAANQFKLTTNFEMKAGDRNAPPYDVFPGDPKDRDTNGDGKVDAMNPFPYGIRREVTLLGTRVSPDRLEGTYIESIRGMLPPLAGNTLVSDQNQFVSNAFLTQSQPVFIEGTFVLERQSFTPTQRSVFNESADLGLEIGGSVSSSRSVTFDVTTPVTVQGVTLSLNLSFPDPALLQISLIGPNPNDNPFVIHQFGDNTAIPSSLVIPASTFTGAGNGTWSLQIEWDTGERGTLQSWGLNIEGASTRQATGRLVKAGSAPVQVIPGASIRLEGGVTTQSFTSAADGTFTIPSLTENDYTLYISKPGYATTTVTFFISENDEALGDIALTPLAITEPQLTAAPPIGYAGTQPLHVEFTVDLPLNFAGSTIAWDFDGNGTTDASGPLATLTETSHDYTMPGIYNAKVTLSGGTLPAPIDKTQLIHVHRGSADPSGGTQQILVNAFVGSFAARTDNAAEDVAAHPRSLTDTSTDIVTYLGPLPVNLASGFVPQESVWDAATFDQDRIPYAITLPIGTPQVHVPFSATGDHDDDGILNQGETGALVISPLGAEDVDLVGSDTTKVLRYLRFNTNADTEIYPTKYQSLSFSQTPTGSRSVELNNPVGFTPYSIPSGTTKPNRFRIATALGGTVFATSPSAVGDIRIQPGRTLP